MKITRRDLGVLMIIAGIIIAFLGYKMSFEPNQEEIEQLQSDQAALKKDIEELKPIKENAPKWEKLIEEYKKNIKDILDEFPAGVKQEDNIMYVVELLDNLNIEIPSFSSSEATMKQEINGAGSLEGTTYQLLTAGLNMVYTVDAYQDMKDMLDYFYSDKEHKRTLDTIGLSFNKETGEVSGSAALTQYVMTDGNKKYEEVKLPLEEIGIESECIFGETEESEE